MYSNGNRKSKISKHLYIIMNMIHKKIENQNFGKSN